MRGKTTLIVTRETVIEAVQEYLDARLGKKMPKQVVKDISHNYNDKTFEILLEECQITEIIGQNRESNG